MPRVPIRIERPDEHVAGLRVGGDALGESHTSGQHGELFGGIALDDDAPSIALAGISIGRRGRDQRRHEQQYEQSQQISLRHKRESPIAVGYRPRA